MVCKSCCGAHKNKKGLWSPEEDRVLRIYVLTHGHGCWSEVPKNAGLQRCGKSCRLRWINYLRPGLKHGAFSPQEEAIIINAHAIVGNRWSQIASMLPGRTDNDIKNFWNTDLQKKLKSMGIDPHTHKPLGKVILDNNLTNATLSSNDIQMKFTSNDKANFEISRPGMCNEPVVPSGSVLSTMNSEMEFVDVKANHGYCYNPLPGVLFAEWLNSTCGEESKDNVGSNMLQISSTPTIDSDNSCFGSPLEAIQKEFKQIISSESANGLERTTFSSDTSGNSVLWASPAECSSSVLFNDLSTSSADTNTVASAENSGADMRMNKDCDDLFENGSFCLNLDFF